METPFTVTRTVSGLAAQRACDECRTRKIRCDRGSPCSHCRAANLACRTTTQRIKEHKDRVQVTKQYESKIDRIESRLANIERLLLLQQASTVPAVPSVKSQASSPKSTSSGRHAINFSQLPRDPNGTTDNIGVQAESLAAKNVFENTIDRDPTVQQDPLLSSALESLRNIVNHVQLDATDIWKTSSAVPSTKVASGIVSPGWMEVRLIVERVEKKKPAVFNWLSTPVLVDFRRCCRMIYEHGQQSSPQERLLVYSCLTNICSEFSTTDQGNEAEYHHNLSRVFSALLMQELSTFPMLTATSIESAEALLSAASTTIGLCRPTVSWFLSCAVARICQALGYNRLSSVDPKSDPLYDRKVVLFWGTYIMDRNTSLRLGRAHAIQDYDIDTPMLTVSEEYPFAIISILKFCVACGRIMGKISTQLYGPASRLLSLNERAETAETYANELLEAQRCKQKAEADIMSLFGKQWYRGYAKMMTLGDDIMISSTLTMALYAIPPSHPHRPRALEAARQCLRAMRDISVNYRESVYVWTIYCHWVLLHTPLTPFTGVFCNVVANPGNSHEDLKLLEDFAASLQPACRLSEGIEKFHQLCAIFVNVAQAYVRAKAAVTAGANTAATDQIPAQSLQPAIGEFDEHFTTLGFFGPQASFNGDEFDAFAGSEQPQSDSMDWYLSNVSLYHLLEQDLNDFTQS